MQHPFDAIIAYKRSLLTVVQWILEAANGQIENGKSSMKSFSTLESVRGWFSRGTSFLDLYQCGGGKRRDEKKITAGERPPNFRKYDSWKKSLPTKTNQFFGGSATSKVVTRQKDGKRVFMDKFIGGPCVLET